MSNVVNLRPPVEQDNDAEIRSTMREMAVDAFVELSVQIDSVRFSLEQLSDDDLAIMWDTCRRGFINLNEDHIRALRMLFELIRSTRENRGRSWPDAG